MLRNKQLLFSPAFQAIVIFTTIAFAGLNFSASSAAAANPNNLQIDVTGTSIEELMNIDVTSASRRSEPLVGTAAAIYVLTSEDIERSGVRSIPEALRLVPGVEV